MPAATMTPKVQALCHKLYPPPMTYISPAWATRAHTMASPPIPMDETALSQTLRRLKKGTAAGPFGDLPNTVKAFALYQPPHSTTLPYFSWFSQVLELILNNQVPSQITPPLLAASHFMVALHKDPTDHTKLRPISMGSALRHVTGKYVMELYGPAFAKFLLPQGQFGIALKGSLQLMVDTARTQLHRHINTSQPTRALLLLNMANMFNCVSRKALRDTLQEVNAQFQVLVPFFDLLYAQPNKCYFRDDTGKLGYFTQQEGVAQGCPLGPVGACMVLHKH
jgi:hypothetical protein